MSKRIGKILPVLLAAGLAAGCASSGPPLPPSLELPAPVSDLHVVRKGAHVSLTWTVPAQTTDHLGIRRPGPTRICRGGMLAACGTPVATLPPEARSGHAKPAPKKSSSKATASYTDELPSTGGAQPGDQVLYAVEAMNSLNRSAGLSNRVAVPLFPAVAPPADFAAKITAQGVAVTWSCSEGLQPIEHVRYTLRIQRTLEGGKSGEQKINAGESDLTDCRGGPLFDPGVDWEKTYDYTGFVVTTVSIPGHPEFEIDGDDTPAVKVFAHDLFPPAAPAGLQAVFSGAGQPLFIDLAWTPDSDADLAGYNVYRREEGGEAVKLNAELVKTPAYRDHTVQNGRKYFYSVSAVDTRGNESAKSDETSESVP